MEERNSDNQEPFEQSRVDMEQLRAAFEQLMDACSVALERIVELFRPFVHALSRQINEMYRLHLIPRHYRVTVARKKMRVYMRFCARRS